MEDPRADRLENKIDKIMEKLTEIAVNQAKDEAEHQALSARVSGVEKDLHPIRKHVARVEGVAKALGLVSVVAAIVASCAQLIHYLH